MTVTLSKADGCRKRCGRRGRRCRSRLRRERTPWIVSRSAALLPEAAIVTTGVLTAADWMMVLLAALAPLPAPIRSIFLAILRLPERTGLHLDRIVDLRHGDAALDRPGVAVSLLSATKTLPLWRLNIPPWDCRGNR